MKEETKEKYKQIRRRYKELKEKHGLKGEKRYLQMQDEFFLGKSQIIGILYSQRLKRKEFD